VNKVDSVCDIALGSSCATLGCDAGKQVFRDQLKRPKEGSTNQIIMAVEKDSAAPKPCVHFDLVASGYSVIESRPHRDEPAFDEDVIAIDLEGAGVGE